MDEQILRLQVLTLASVVVLVLLCVALLAVAWVALNLSQLLERLRGTLSRFAAPAKPLTPPDVLPFRELDWVQVTHEMSWICGTGTVVPVGALIQLLNRFETSSGPRWTARWKRSHLHSVPEDMLARIAIAPNPQRAGELLPIDWSSEEERRETREESQQTDPLALVSPPSSLVLPVHSAG